MSSVLAWLSEGGPFLTLLRNLRNKHKFVLKFHNHWNALHTYGVVLLGTPAWKEKKERMNCQKGGCSCKQTQPNSTNFFFCPGPLATFCWPNLPIKIDIFSMDFHPNLEENYPRLQKVLVLVGSWTLNPTKLRFKAQAKQHQKGGGASNLWTRKVASPSLSLFFSSLIFSMASSAGKLSFWQKSLRVFFTKILPDDIIVTVAFNGLR